MPNRDFYFIYLPIYLTLIIYKYCKIFYRYCKKLKNIIAYHIAKGCSKGWLHVAFLFESYNFFNGLKVKNELDPYRRHTDATVRLNRILKLALRKRCPYSEFFWSVFSRNAGKYVPGKL